MRRSARNKKQVTTQVCNYLESLLEDTALINRVKNDVELYGRHDHYLPRPIKFDGYYDNLLYTNEPAYKELIKTFNSNELRIETNIDRFMIIHYRLENNYKEEDGFINEVPDLKVISFSPQSSFYKYLDRYRNYKYHRKYKKDRD